MTKTRQKALSVFGPCVFDHLVVGVDSTLRPVSTELLNNLFFNPYTNVQFVVEPLDVSRITATKYLEALTEKGLATKYRVGRNNYAINEPLIQLIVIQQG